jgi:hypothetical protein
MSERNETPHLDNYFFTKMDNFEEIVREARRIDPVRVERLIESHQNLCDVIDELHDIIDSE